jgi:ferric-dicitrate binding protein FerR (iron transport regulator)
MDKQSLAELVRKWRTGQATPDEITRLEAWWQQALQDESYLASLPEAEQQALKTGMYRDIWQRIGRREKQETPTPQRPEAGKTVPLKAARRVYWRVAAAIALLIAAGTLLFRPAGRDALHREQTAYGVRKEITLPDRSVVVLNGNSSLAYAPEWEEGQPREVWLEGEAYFAVKHTAGHQRFTVHTADALQVEVLGTRFNVQQRRGVTEVVLQEGKVKVSDQAQVYTMQPGEMVRRSARSPRLTARRVNPQVATAWKDNLLIFRDATIQSIAEQLADSHGIRVEFRNQDIKNELFNGSVPADSVALLFTKLEKLYSVEVSRENGVYILK